MKGRQISVNLNPFNSSVRFLLAVFNARQVSSAGHPTFLFSLHKPNPGILSQYKVNSSQLEDPASEMPYWSVLLLTLHSFEAVFELIFLLTSAESRFRKFDNIPLALKWEPALWTLGFVEALTCVTGFISASICYQSILWPPPQFPREALSTVAVHCHQQREVQLWLPFPLPLLLTLNSAPEVHRIFLQASCPH